MHSGKYLEMYGKKIFYIDSGETDSDKIILFLHGYSFSSANWLNIGAIEHFQALDYRVLLLDYPGFGKSEVIDEFKVGEGQLKNAGKFLCGVLDSLQIEKCTVVGPSMGGGILIDSYSDCGSRIDTMVLIAPAWYKQNNLNRIKSRKIFIWGSMDDLIPIESVKDQLSHLDNSIIEVIEGGKHAPYLNKPDVFFEICRRHLS